MTSYYVNNRLAVFSTHLNGLFHLLSNMLNIVSKHGTNILSIVYVNILSQRLKERPHNEEFYHFKNIVDLILW